MRRVLPTIAVLYLLSPTAQAQQPASPAFEVVSIKPNTALDRSGMISSPLGTQFRVSNIALRMIITYAYDLRDLDLVDAPGWTSAEKFDITATYPATASHTLEEAQLMMQRVLSERFGLRVHRETRELPIYRLVKARDDGKLGPNLVPSDVDCVKWLAEKKSQIIGTPPIGPGGARPACLMVPSRTYLLAGTKSVSDLARALETIVDRNVFDATGITGNFDMTLLWTATPGLDGQPSAVANNTDSVSLFTALQEQLGLKLEPARGPGEVLVIDSVQRPTPN